MEAAKANTETERVKGQGGRLLEKYLERTLARRRALSRGGDSEGDLWDRFL